MPTLGVLFQNLKLLNENLTPKKVIEILSEDDPRVADGEGCLNLELEVGCGISIMSVQNL